MCTVTSTIFASAIDALNHRDPDCMQKIAVLRTDLEKDLVAGTLTRREWRTLLEEVSVVQARFSAAHPNAWRSPINDFTVVPDSPTEFVSEDAHPHHGLSSAPT